MTTEFKYLIEGWTLDDKLSQSAGLYWKGLPVEDEPDTTTTTKDPFEALAIDQPNVAHQLASVLNRFEPVVIHGVKGKWAAILHGFDGDGGHIPYPSEEQIVEHLFDGLEPGDRKHLIHLGDNGHLASAHHDFGMWLRNTYNLWHAENPHTMKGYVPELKDGVDVSPRHPDNVSGRIIEALYRKVKGAS